MQALWFGFILYNQLSGAINKDHDKEAVEEPRHAEWNKTFCI